MKWFRSQNLYDGWGILEIIFTAKNKEKAIEKVKNYIKIKKSDVSNIDDPTVTELDPNKIHEFSCYP